MKIPKNSFLLLLVLLLVGSGLACAQGTFVYDQQSSTNDALGNAIQPVAFGGSQTIGQSFVPALAAINFVRMRFGDTAPFPSGATGLVSVNLWSGGISNGVLLAATAPVLVSLSSLSGKTVTNFFFAASVTLTPGATYYLQPFLQASSGSLGVELFSSFYSTPFSPYSDTYLAGSAVPNPAGIHQDLWFREGIIVPEPSSIGLLGLAVIVFIGKWLVFGEFYAGKSKALIFRR